MVEGNQVIRKPESQAKRDKEREEREDREELRLRRAQEQERQRAQEQERQRAQERERDHSDLLAMAAAAERRIEDRQLSRLVEQRLEQETRLAWEAQRQAVDRARDLARDLARAQLRPPAATPDPPRRAPARVPRAYTVEQLAAEREAREEEERRARRIAAARQGVANRLPTAIRVLQRITGTDIENLLSMLADTIEIFNGLLQRGGPHYYLSDHEWEFARNASFFVRMLLTQRIRDLMVVPLDPMDVANARDTQDVAAIMPGLRALAAAILDAAEGATGGRRGRGLALPIAALAAATVLGAFAPAVFR